MVVCCLDEGSNSVLYALRVQQGFCWAVSLRGICLNRDSCPLLTALPETLTSVSSVCLATAELSSYRVCEGNPDERFLKLSQKGSFMDTSGRIE